MTYNQLIAAMQENIDNYERMIAEDPNRSDADALKRVIAYYRNEISKMVKQ